MQNMFRLVVTFKRTSDGSQTYVGEFMTSKLSDINSCTVN